MAFPMPLPAPVIRAILSRKRSSDIEKACPLHRTRRPRSVRSIYVVFQLTIRVFTGGCVMNGTPSILLGTSTPSKWIAVLSFILFLRDDPDAVTLGDPDGRPGTAPLVYLRPP